MVCYDKLTNENLFLELNNNCKDEKVSTKILKEINKRILNNSLNFNKELINYLYLYLFMCNRYGCNDVLSNLIKDEEFIHVLDESDITGSMIISLTGNLDKPRDILLRNSKKVKESILGKDELFSVADIVYDLSKEEVLILREDRKIDNFLITEGLSFDTLKDDIKEKILKDPSILSIYDMPTIIEFTESVNDIKSLASNEKFLNLYISKLDDDYSYDNKLFNYIDLNSLNYILSVSKDEKVLLHLVKDTKTDIQKVLLKDKKVLKLLDKTLEFNVLKALPSGILESIIESKKERLKGVYQELISFLTKKDIEKLFNNGLYEEFIDSLRKEENINVVLLVHSLPTKLLNDLAHNKLEMFSLRMLESLYKANPGLIKKSILSNKVICDKVINHSSYDDIEDFIKSIELDDNDLVLMLNNLDDIKNKDVLVKIVEHLSLSARGELYKNDKIRKEIISLSKILDDYLVKYLLNNIEDINGLNKDSYYNLLFNLDQENKMRILDNNGLLLKLFKDNKNDFSNLGELLKNNKYLLSYYENDDVLEYYNCDNINYILDVLDIKEKNEFCTKKLILLLVDNDEELYKQFRNLQARNAYLLNTFSFKFFKFLNYDIKTSVLDDILRYKILQDYICDIDMKFKLSGSLINMVAAYLEDLALNPTIIDIVKIFRDSVLGINRKVIGNIPKLLNILDFSEVRREDINIVVNYLLYLIPRFYDVKGNALKGIRVIDTPKSYNDIKKYEDNVNTKLRDLVLNSESIKDYFIQRHFKLTLEEATIFSKMYDIEGVSQEIYSLEYDYIDSLSKVLNTDEEDLVKMIDSYKIYSMREVFVLQKKIKEMYGKIYNYEIKTHPMKGKYTIYKLYGKDIKVYDLSKEFYLLLANFKIELDGSYNYFEAWHNYLNKLDEGVKTTLVANDNLMILDDFAFGFDGVLNEGIMKMSSKDISGKDSSLELYANPIKLNDMTRKSNTIIISKYALRPNYNNGNIPNIEPDFVLVDSSKLNDHSYFERAARASEDFKSKRNVEGLPIIAINYEKIIDNEVSKIIKLISRYKKNHDMELMKNILVKSENLISSLFNSVYKDKFDVMVVMDLLNDRIGSSNSVKELEYLKDVFVSEYYKFDNTGNYDLEIIKKAIDDRIVILNNI